MLSNRKLKINEKNYTAVMSALTFFVSRITGSQTISPVKITMFLIQRPIVASWEENRLLLQGPGVLET